MIRIAVLVLALLGGTQAAAVQTSNGTGADMRVLDKITGEVTDIALGAGQVTSIGHLRVVLNECRYPVNNPNGDAYINLVVFYQDDSEPVFQGWMIASAPALHAMDHPRYDIWALRCSRA